MIITELCVFEVKKGHGLILTEIADGVTVEQVCLGFGVLFGWCFWLFLSEADVLATRWMRRWNYVFVEI